MILTIWGENHKLDVCCWVTSSILESQGLAPGQ